ncbi:MAG: hypothetical protein J1E83_08940 [Lachnospiraceae bacterium]|nr:hypothetical protein [Lachnospiraceae bacterium]
MANDNPTYRNVILRISVINKIHVDNGDLGVKAGDTVINTIEAIKKVLDDWTKTKDLKYYMIEHNAGTERAHVHIVLCFAKNSQCTGKTLKNKFPYGFIEKCKYGVKNAVQYLVHMNNPEKTQYSWDEVITNAPHKLEFFKVPGRQILTVKAQTVIDNIISGKLKEHEIDKIDPDVYIEFGTKIRNAFDYRQKLVMTNPERDIEVHVLEGPSRVGKSTFCRVMAKKFNKSIYFSSSSNDPYQDLKTQDILVLDDFDYRHIKIDDMKKMLDPFIMSTMYARYKNKLFVGDTIFICTNTPIITWYSQESLIDREAIFGRITSVMRFEFSDTKYVANYTVNEIVKVEDGTEDDIGNGFTYKRVSDEIKVFDMRKYIDTSLNKTKNEEFLKMLDEI